MTNQITDALWENAVQIDTYDCDNGDHYDAGRNITVDGTSGTALPPDSIPNGRVKR